MSKLASSTVGVALKLETQTMRLIGESALRIGRGVDTS